MSIALLAGVLGLVGGAFATFTDTVAAGPQTISSGKILLATGPTNDSAIGASNIVAGDTVSREIDLNSNGQTVVGADASIKLSFTSAPSTLLDTDATNGLQLAIQACPTAWVRSPVSGQNATPPAVTYTCTPGPATTVLIGGAASASVSTLETTPAALTGNPATTPLNSANKNGQDFLLFTLSLPNSAPGDFSKVAAACSGTSGGTSANENLEGCTSGLTYTFVAIQRNGAPQ